MKIKTWFSFFGILILCSWAKAEKFLAHDLPGTGGGYTMSASSFSFLSLHYNTKVADINNDNRPDLVVLANGLLDGCFENAYACGNDIEPSHVLYNSGLGSTSPNVRAGDVGISALGIGPYKGSDLGWFENDGDGNFVLHLITPRSIAANPNSEEPAFIHNGQTLQTDDLDNDGDLDIVVWAAAMRDLPDIARGAARLTWFENLRNQSQLALDGGPAFLQHDIVNYSSSNFSANGVTFRADSPTVGAIVDVDGDGRKDIVTANYVGPECNHYWFKNTGNNGSGMFDTTNVWPIQVQPAGSNPPQPYVADGTTMMVVADVNGDNHPDILRSCGQFHGDFKFDLLINQSGSANLTDPFQLIHLRTNYDISNNEAVKVGDLYQESCPEVVVGGFDYGSNQGYIEVFTTGNFPQCNSWSSTELPDSREQEPGISANYWDVQLVDIDGDLRQDVVAYWIKDNTFPVADSKTVVRYWINNGGSPSSWSQGTLEENSFPPLSRWNYPGRLGGGIGVADFDGDGDMDILRSHHQMDLCLFENTWHTEKFFAIDSSAQKNRYKQKVVSTFAVRGDGSRGRLLGQRIDRE